MPVANARMYSVTPSCKADWKRVLGWALDRAALDWPVIDYDAPAPLAALWSRNDLGVVMMCGLPFSQREPRPTLVAAPLPSPARYGGKPVYYTDIVVAARSPYRTLEDTFGSVVGYTLADSMSGGVALRDHLERYRTPQRPRLYRASVGNLIHARGVIEAIAAGTIDVGPLDSYCHDLLKHNDPPFAAQVRTVASTDARPIPPIVATAPISASELARLREALLEARHAPSLAEPMARLLLDGFAVPDPADYDALAADRCTCRHPFRGTLMMMKRLLLAVAFAALPLLAAAQSYPVKPIRIVVPFPPGGPTDVLGRLVGEGIGEALRQPVVVDNKSGAAGNIGVDLVAKAAPDGYTLGVVPVGNVAVNPALYPNLPYKQSDLAPVTMLATVENVLVVNAAAVPARTLKELLALAAQKPAALSYASPGAGSQAHLAGELLELSAGVHLLHVPYRGIAPAVNDLVGGQVSMMFAPFQTALPHIKSGKLRAIGVASLKRSPLMPELPTIAEQGVPKFEAVSWYALMAPSGTPADIVDKLSAESTRVLGRPDIKEKLAAQGMDAGGGAPQQLAATVQAETRALGGGDPQAEHQAGVIERGLRLAFLPDFGASTFQRRRKQSRGRAACSASLRRSARSADCTAMLGPGSRRRTHCVRCALFVQTCCDKSVHEARCARRPRPCASRRRRGAAHAAHPRLCGKRRFFG